MANRETIPAVDPAIEMTAKVLEAFKECTKALQPLQPDQRTRILKAVAILFDIQVDTSRSF